MAANELSARLREAITLSGINRKQLALALGVTRSAVDYWMSGERTPDTVTLERIAIVLGVKPSWLAFGEGEGP